MLPPSMCHAYLFQLALQKNVFFDIDIVVKNKSKCALAWSVLLSTMIRVITVVKMLWTQQILTTVLTHIVVDKSTDHAKPHFDLFFNHNINMKEHRHARRARVIFFCEVL